MVKYLGGSLKAAIQSIYFEVAKTVGVAKESKML